MQQADPFAAIAEPVKKDDPFAEIAVDAAATPAQAAPAKAPEGKLAKGWRVANTPLLPEGKAEAEGHVAAEAPPTNAETDFTIKHPALGPLLAGAKRFAAGTYADTMETVRGFSSPLALATAGAGALGKAPGAVGKAASAVSKVAGVGFAAQGGAQAVRGAGDIARTGANPENLKETLSGTGQALLGAGAAVPEVTGGDAHRFARRLVDADTDVKSHVKDAAEKADAAHTEHLQKAQRVHEENRGAEQTLDLRRKSEAELKAKTDAYYAKEDEVHGQAKAENDKNWDSWRKKVADVEVDMKPVRATIERVSADFPEVKKIIAQTAPSEADLSAANQQFLADRRGFMHEYGYGNDYDSLHPERKAQVDAMMGRLGLYPEEGIAAMDESKPVSMRQLHDLKTQIGWKIFRREYDPVTTGAMKQVYKSLEQAEARGSIQAGALPELEAARDSHAKLQEAFGRSKVNRATVADARKRGANPDAFKQQEEDARVRAASQHDPDLADMHRDIQSHREQLKKIPSEETLRKSLKQVPPLPEKPTVDIGDVARDAIAKKAENWGRFGKRDIGILATSVLAGFISGNWLHALEGGIAFEAANTILSQRLNKPAVIDWLARTPPEEVEVLAKIPGVDKVKIMDGVTEVALDSAKNGKPVKLSPGAKSLLGPANVARILAASNAGSNTRVNNRKDALQLLGR